MSSLEVLKTILSEGEGTLSQELIGAEDAYMSTCLGCYIAKTNPRNYITSIPLQKSNTKFSHTFPTNWR